MKQLPGSLKTASRLSINSPHLIALHHQAMIDFFDKLDEQQGRVEGSQQLDKQRWWFEQQLWLLLPSVLLPCANNLLLMASETIVDPARKQTQREREAWEGLAWGLIEVSNRALHGYCKMSNRLEGGPSRRVPPDLAWARELLDRVLQLADHLLLQQRSKAELPAKSTGASSSSKTGNNTPAALPSAPVPYNASSSGSAAPRPWSWRASCAGEVVQLLTRLVYDINAWFPDCSSTVGPLLADGQPNSDGASADAAPVEVTPPAPMVPLVAERFVKVCTILEAALRAVTTAAQSLHSMHLTPFEPCLVKLLLGCGDGDDAKPELAKHIGLHGAATRALELQHFYSVLSTVQKLARCESWAGHGHGSVQEVANTCCWAAAGAAAVSPTAGVRAAAAAPLTAGKQAQVPLGGAAIHVSSPGPGSVGDWSASAHVDAYMYCRSVHQFDS
jgi:hypothetical protein